MPAADLGWVLELTGERTLAGTATRRREMGLTDAIIETAAQVATDALQDHGLLRTELLERFETAGLHTDQGRGYHLIFALALHRIIVFGPFSGTEQLIVLFQSPHQQRRQPDRARAPATLVRHYLDGRGPATLADIARWSKLPLRDLKPALEELEPDLTAMEHSGERFWALTATVDLAETAGCSNPPSFIGDEPSDCGQRSSPSANTPLRSIRLTTEWRRPFELESNPRRRNMHASLVVTARRLSRSNKTPQSVPDTQDFVRR